MRVIDADAIQYWQDDSGIKSMDYTRRGQIDSMPTIEAIPVEWIEKQKAECYPRSLAWIALEALLKTWKEEMGEAEERDVRNDG